MGHLLLLIPTIQVFLTFGTFPMSDRKSIGGEERGEEKSRRRWRRKKPFLSRPSTKGASSSSSSRHVRRRRRGRRGVGGERKPFPLFFCLLLASPFKSRYLDGAPPLPSPSSLFHLPLLRNMVSAPTGRRREDCVNLKSFPCPYSSCLPETGGNGGRAWWRRSSLPACLVQAEAADVSRTLKGG